MQCCGFIRREYSNNSMVEQVSIKFHYIVSNILFVLTRSKSLTGVHPFAQEPLYASISKIVYNNEKIILFTQEKVF